MHLLIDVLISFMGFNQGGSQCGCDGGHKHGTHYNPHVCEEHLCNANRDNRTCPREHCGYRPIQTLQIDITIAPPYHLVLSPPHLPRRYRFSVQAIPEASTHVSKPSYDEEQLQDHYSEVDSHLETGETIHLHPIREPCSQAGKEALTELRHDPYQTCHFHKAQDLENLERARVSICLQRAYQEVNGFHKQCQKIDNESPPQVLRGNRRPMHDDVPLFDVARRKVHHEVYAPKGNDDATCKVEPTFQCYIPG
mmetsp:Transcript_28589/g.63189  ORF Transcript_28589/g.63189 Transcript_28589/m.63189 type:complete len:252 (-) Transcript_28589:8-763(-)